MRSNGPTGFCVRGIEPAGVRVRRTAAGGGTTPGRRSSRITFDPTAEIIATASSVPSGDIEQGITR